MFTIDKHRTDWWRVHPCRRDRHRHHRGRRLRSSWFHNWLSSKTSHFTVTCIQIGRKSREPVDCIVTDKLFQMWRSLKHAAIDRWEALNFAKNTNNEFSYDSSGCILFSLCRFLLCLSLPQSRWVIEIVSSHVRRCIVARLSLHSCKNISWSAFSGGLPLIAFDFVRPRCSILLSLHGAFRFCAKVQLSSCYGVVWAARAINHITGDVTGAATNDHESTIAGSSRGTVCMRQAGKPFQASLYLSKGYIDFVSANVDTLSRPKVGHRGRKTTKELTSIKSFCLNSHYWISTFSKLQFFACSLITSR